MTNINTTKKKVHQHFQCLDFRPSFLSMPKASQCLCIISINTVPSYEMLCWQLTLHQKDNFFHDSVHIIQALKMDTQCIIASNDVFVVDFSCNIYLIEKFHSTTKSQVPIMLHPTRLNIPNRPFPTSHQQNKMEENFTSHINYIRRQHIATSNSSNSIQPCNSQS